MQLLVLLFFISIKIKEWTYLRAGICAPEPIGLTGRIKSWFFDDYKLSKLVLSTVEPLSNIELVVMKCYESAISFILEDFVEVGLQFFYFEKFSFMSKDTLVYFNAVFMILKALDLTIRMLLWIKEYWGTLQPQQERQGSFWKIV